MWTREDGGRAVRARRGDGVDVADAGGGGGGGLAAAAGGRAATRVAGGVARAVYACEDDVVDVCWCAFGAVSEGGGTGGWGRWRGGEARAAASDGGDGWFACALHRDSFSVFGVSGETRRMPLGFEAEAFAPTSAGLLVVSCDGVAALVPHALAEPTTIDGLNDRETPVSVAWSDAMKPVVLFYVPSRGAHELWKLSLVPSGIGETEFGASVPEFRIRAELCWSESVRADFSPETTSYDLAHDENGREMILVSEDAAHRVYGLYVSSMPPGGVRSSKIIEGAFSALGVAATRKSTGMRDTVAVCSDGTLALYVGSHALCKLRATTEDGQTGYVESVLDVSRDIATVRCRGRETVRIRIPGALSSPHARAVMDALREVCHGSDLMEINERLYSNEFVGVDDPEREWSCLASVLSAWCGLSYESSTPDVLSDLELAQRILADSSAACANFEVSANAAVNAHRVELVLDAAHTVYEASKIDLLFRSMMEPLLRFATGMARVVADVDYLDYYARENGTAMRPPQRGARRRVPDIMRAIEGILAGEANFHTFIPPLILEGLQDGSMVNADEFGGEVVVRARRILKLCHASTVDTANISSSGGAFALAMTEMGFKVEDLERLPPGLALPFHGILRCCRDSPSNNLPAEAYALIGRHDLALMYGDVDLIRDAKLRHSQLATAKMRPDSAAAPDGLEHLEEFVGPLRFPRDYRIRELRAILSTASPVPLELGEGENAAGDTDGQGTQHQSRLIMLATRTAALPVGRGAATLGTVVAKPTEALQTPTLCFAGSLPTQQHAVVNLDLTAPDAPKDFANWPEFHNGAASGLALRSDDDGGKLNRAWIVFNRPKVPTFSHAGVLMALGLNGHLSGLTATDLYRYLAQEHEATTVGTLLGVAASKLGTGDPATSRMCFLHVPTRHPLSFPEIELPSLVQSCALLSVGLLYQSTAQRLIVETLLSELGKSPEGDVINGRECYALSAGLALGLVTLGRGHSASGLSDLHIAERLRHFTVGGVAKYIPPPGGMTVTSATRKFASANAAFHDQYAADDAWMNQNSSVTDAQPASVDGYILEGYMVNVDLSAPGAIMALGLMYLKTNDASVSAHLAIPSTHYALDDARPDYVLLRVVARSLIMWDTIDSSPDWIEGLLPPLLRDAMDPKSPAERETQNDSSWLGQADREAIAQTYVHALAGGCMAIGLRYAGSGNASAATTLRQYAMKFLEWKKNAGQDVREMLVNKATLETCIGVIAMSLACVMAGTGDLPTLRLLRHLRSRLETNVLTSTGLTYGAHMAIGMANGFLFLGGCAQTFSTDNASIAALLISMFPRFPSHPNDNRWYCQAYRHLYALAAKDRLLNTVDATTLEPVSTPVEITTSTPQGGEVCAQLITPCLLPDPSDLVRIKLISPRYWTTDLEFARMQSGAKDALYELRTIPVQRHTAALSYEVDRTGAKAQLSTALHAAGARAALKPPTVEITRNHNTAPVANATAARAGKDAVDVFTTDSILLSFATSMCDGASDRAGFSAAALRECMEREVPEALRSYMDMYASCEAIIHVPVKSSDAALAATLAVADLRIVSAFQKLLQRSSASASIVENAFPMPYLLASSFRQTLLLHLDAMYGGEDNSSILRAYVRGAGYDCASDAHGGFGCYLRLLDMPSPSLLQSALAQGGATQLSVRALRAFMPEVDPSTLLRVVENFL